MSRDDGGTLLLCVTLFTLFSSVTQIIHYSNILHARYQTIAGFKADLLPTAPKERNQPLFSLASTKLVFQVKAFQHTAFKFAAFYSYPNGFSYRIGSISKRMYQKSESTGP